jgi:hypothetical protein
MNKYRQQAKAAQQARLQARACEGKTRYPREAEARAKADQYGQETYACRFCGGWHLTASMHKTARLIRSRGRAIILDPRIKPRRPE